MDNKTANELCDYFDQKYDKLNDRVLVGYEAQYLAANGWLVVVGQKAGGHGHVAVVTGAELDKQYNEPYVYCGSLGVFGKSKGNKCVKQVFGLDPVAYWLCPTRPSPRPTWKDL